MEENEIIKAKIFVLKIPFKFSFGHFLKKRSYSDSIIVEITADNGVQGYGEGIARTYVTGESVEKSVKHIKEVLLPAVMHRNINDIKKSENPIKTLSHISNIIPDICSSGIIAWNASVTAVELALIDCLLKKQKKILKLYFACKFQIVTYSVVFSSEDLKSTIELASELSTAVLNILKLKLEKITTWNALPA